MEPRDKEKNAKKIIPVRIAAYAVAKRKPENSGLLKLKPDLCDTGGSKLTGRWSLNWFVVGKDEDEMISYVEDDLLCDYLLCNYYTPRLFASLTVCVFIMCKLTVTKLV